MPSENHCKYKTLVNIVKKYTKHFYSVIEQVVKQYKYI